MSAEHEGRQGARIASIICAFRAAAALSGLPGVAAAGAAARSVTELAPLPAARPTIYAAGVVGRGGAAVTRAEAERLSKESVQETNCCGIC